MNSLTVGNGNFAYTVDITGMQSYPEFYEKGIPLGTQSNWGWHSFPNPDNYNFNDVYRKYKVGNDTIPYLYQYMGSPESRKVKATDWLRENPQRLHLGLLGLEFINTDSSKADLQDIQNPEQKLNLWKGEIISEYTVLGVPVKVITFCHQEMDLISVRIESDLIEKERLRVKLTLPYATHEKFSSGCDLNHAGLHTSAVISEDSENVVLMHKLDSSEYYINLNWKGNAEFVKSGEHVFYIVPLQGSNVFEISCLFTKDNTKIKLIPGFNATKDNNEEAWKKFWKTGGAIDFSACKNKKATELERRVVLSQYLTKVQCSGTLPPQETGLTFNSWHGKFHLEMHWWHGVHFILWNRSDIMERQMKFYSDIYDEAEKTAKKQGYKGVRWPKMVGPEGTESPSFIGTFLIWQQPHYIYYSELLYQNSNHKEQVLNQYKKLVFATADFMADYARFDSTLNQYVLGPALIPAQERFNPETTINPVFELAYWYWGLKTAQQWRQRSGLPVNNNWQDVIDHISPLAVKDSLYLFCENAADSYTNPAYLTDHPIVAAISGFLPETGMVDRKIMTKTFDKLLETWNWETIWGWDIPLMAMNATVLDRKDQAVDFLLMDTPKNTYLPNGHNYQDKTLTLYLPGNGGLLTAVAFMCTYRDSDGKNGFPDNGKWDVKYENLNKLH